MRSFRIAHKKCNNLTPAIKTSSLDFNPLGPAVTLIKIKIMKKAILHNSFKMALLIVCLAIKTKGIGQVSVRSVSDEIMKPESQHEEKRRLPIRFGLGAETFVAGNAKGAFYSANLNLSRGKSLLSLGPCIQKRTLQINAVKLSYSYLLSGINDRYDADELNEMKDDPSDILELRLLCYVQYTHQGSLSYKASRVETITNPESRINFNEVKFSTLEGAVSAELDINLKGLKIRTYMGFTTFYHFKYIDNMYRAKCSPALTFGVGVVIPHL